MGETTCNLLVDQICHLYYDVVQSQMLKTTGWTEPSGADCLLLIMISAWGLLSV